MFPCPERRFPTMNIDSVKSAHLSTSCGKFVSVQKRMRSKSSHQLVAEHMQKYNLGNSGKVKVYHILYNRTTQCMAFGFEEESKSSLVFPVVNHDQDVKYKVLPTDKKITARTFDETFLFQWGEQNISGDWRSLQSVAEPQNYLCVKTRGKVTITKEQIPDFRIHYSDEKNDTELQCPCRSGKIQDETNKFKMTSNLKRGSSCCEGSAAPNKPLHYNQRKTKKMKMSVKS